jgi:hypothetical protein
MLWIRKSLRHQAQTPFVRDAQISRNADEQAVTFLSDGGDTVRDLQMYLNPQAEHLLDWFHISMRLTVMRQLAKKIEADDQPNLSAEIEKELERIKWNLWHGNVSWESRLLEPPFEHRRHSSYHPENWRQYGA